MIDVLHDDTTTLHSTSLVCRSWVHHSRIHIFRHLTIYLRANPGPDPVETHASIDAYKRLTDILRRSPEISDAIQDVRICAWDFIGIGSPAANPYPGDILADLLSYLTCVTTLELQYLLWHSYPLEIRLAIRLLFANSSGLKTVAFNYCSFPGKLFFYSFFRHCRSLENLFIGPGGNFIFSADIRVQDEVRFINDQTGHWPSGTSCPLRNITIEHDAPSVIDWLMDPTCSPDVSLVRRLQLGTGGESQCTMLTARLFKSIGRSLTHLLCEEGWLAPSERDNFSSSLYSDNIPPFITDWAPSEKEVRVLDTTSNSCLEMLAVVEIKLDLFRNSSATPLLIFLSNLVPPPKLRSLKLSFFHSEEDTLNWDYLRAVDVVLSDEKFRQLSNIALQIGNYPDHHGVFCSMEIPETHIRANFPNMNARGILDVLHLETPIRIDTD